MKEFWLAVLIASSVTAVMADDDQPPCTAHDNGLNFDLNPLSASSDYVFTSYSGRKFNLNVCAPVSGDTWNLQIDPKEIGGFTRGAHSDISIGKPSTSLVVRNGNPFLLLTEGSNCPLSDNMKAETAIRFLCDPNSDTGSPELVAQFPGDDENACSFFIEWRSQYACPVPDRYAYWKTALMIIVILLVLVLTFLGLHFFMKMIKRRRGGGGVSIPLDDVHRPWYTVITDQVRDLGRLLTGQDPWGRPGGSSSGRVGVGAGDETQTRRWIPSFKWIGIGGGRRSRQHFSRLPRSAEEEAMMGSNRGGPFSVDDDDDDDEGGVGHSGAAVAVGMNGDAGTFAEESAAWGATRPSGMDNSGVIRL